MFIDMKAIPLLPIHFLMSPIAIILKCKYFLTAILFNEL